MIYLVGGLLYVFLVLLTLNMIGVYDIVKYSVLRKRRAVENSRLR